MKTPAARLREAAEKHAESKRPMNVYWRDAHVNSYLAGAQETRAELVGLLREAVEVLELFSMFNGKPTNATMGRRTVLLSKLHAALKEEA